VQRIFIFEGMVIGILSLIIAILLALTPGIIVGNIPGRGLIDAPPGSPFFADRVILWLVIVLVFPTIASFYPAWKASRLTVNEVLAYE
jgi:putative ABC transport system permease protein